MDNPLYDPITKYEFLLPRWTDRIDHSKRMVLISSGRGGGGKSRNISLLVLLEALKKRQTILCLREVQKNLDDSTLPIITRWLEHPALKISPDFYKIRGGEIKFANGSNILFRGLSSSSGTSNRIKSFEGVSLAYIDEGQDITDESVRLLMPTIREKGSRIWISYNPRTPLDAVSKLARAAKDDPRRQHIKLTLEDNPWFKTSELEDERRTWQIEMPESYAHTWLGEFASENPYALIPYEQMIRCWDDWDPALLAQSHDEWHDMGFDVAVSEVGDTSALARRCGAEVTLLTEWRGKRFRESCRRIKEHNDPIARWLYYDASGIGEGFGDDLMGDEDFPTELTPVRFGGEVKGKKVHFSPSLRNEHHFARRGSQLYWALRIRVRNTLNFLAGDEADPKRCIFFDKRKIDEKVMQKLASEASIAAYTFSKSSKMEIDKAPNGADSPNLLDAVVLAFEYDSRYGLLKSVEAARVPDSVGI